MKRVSELCLCSLAVLGIASCVPAAPGEGEKAEIGLSKGNDLVNKLEGYKLKYGHYPLSLVDVDSGIGSDGAMQGHDDIKFLYGSRGKLSYRIVLKYFGPGSNTCIHDETDKPGRWDCSGTL
jgi:hypothetical protein